MLSHAHTTDAQFTYVENSAARPNVKGTRQDTAYVGGNRGLGVSSTLYSTERNLSYKKKCTEWYLIYTFSCFK